MRCLSADDQVSEPIGDSMVRARGAVVGRVGERDQSEADDRGELADGFEQRSARWAQIVDLVAAARSIQAVAAGLTFEMGHRAPFAWVSSVTIDDN
jgi:hypothetical protein